MNAATNPAFTVILNTYAPNGDFIHATTLGTRRSQVTTCDLLRMLAGKVSHLTSGSYSLIVKSRSGMVKSYPNVVDQSLENAANAAYMNR